ncbi:MAG: hypothetical protein HOP12_12145 [Candidatus Eisenbacteria bacterium]|uniref:Outer membrane protein beta-barrel domain-containing protein n=1 Tax=Eiseniibacteriota bacterium TaxID=2212470 RepID=A0A849SS75_UNCEI|nr:hypothetical protein [Candidatus Eisenbacteria bacterium]
MRRGHPVPFLATLGVVMLVACAAPAPASARAHYLGAGIGAFGTTQAAEPGASELTDIAILLRAGLHVSRNVAIEVTAMKFDGELDPPSELATHNGLIGSTVFALEGQQMSFRGFSAGLGARVFRHLGPFVSSARLSAELHSSRLTFTEVDLDTLGGGSIIATVRDLDETVWGVRPVAAVALELPLEIASLSRTTRPSQTKPGVQVRFGLEAGYVFFNEGDYGAMGRDRDMSGWFALFAARVYGGAPPR